MSLPRDIPADLDALKEDHEEHTAALWDSIRGLEKDVREMKGKK